MENNISEAAKMKHIFSEQLKDIHFLCNRLKQKSERILFQLENSDVELNTNSLEKMGLTIALMLETLKGNSTVSINNLLKELDILNCGRPKKLFSDMITKLLQCRSNTVNKENDKYSFIQFAEKETLTDDCFNLKCESSPASFSKNDLFSLRRQATTDTLRTEDSWEDTLQRTKGTISGNNKEHNFNNTIPRTGSLQDNGSKLSSEEKVPPTVKNQLEVSVSSDHEEFSTKIFNNQISDQLEDEMKSNIIFNQSDDDNLKEDDIVKKVQETETVLDKNKNKSPIFTDFDEVKYHRDFCNSLSTFYENESISSDKSVEDIKYKPEDLNDVTKKLSTSEQAENTADYILEKNSQKLIDKEQFNPQTKIVNINSSLCRNSTENQNKMECVINKESLVDTEQNEDETNKDYNEFQEYCNPYSVETEKISSEEETEQISQEQCDLSKDCYNCNCRKCDMCLSNEHKYSSANLYIDSEKEIVKTNSKHNFNNVNVEHEDLSSNQSYEFDISNYANLENTQQSLKDDSIARESKQLIENNENTENGVKDKETIKEDDDNLLDVTMEEILSNDEKDNHKSSLETISYCDLKVEKQEAKSEESDDNEDIEKSVFDEPINTVADELLILLGNVPKSPIEDYLLRQPTIDDSDESINVEKLLQNLKDDSELSDSVDSDCSVNISDLNTNSNENAENVGCNDEISHIDKEDLLKKYNLPECYVSLEQVHVSQDILKRLVKAQDNNIDWLCDLQNLSLNRKCISSSSVRKRYRKKRLVVDLSESLSNYSSEESCGISRSNSPNLNYDQKERLDDILADAICNDLKDGSDDLSDSNSSSDICDINETKKKNFTPVKDKSNKTPLTKEELEKQAWKKDPLLRGNFSFSDSDGVIKEAKKRKVCRYEDDTDFSIQSDDDSDSNKEDTLTKNKLKLKEKKISPIKNNLPISDDSDSDSDVQYISPKTKDGNEEHGSVHSQKGRRNIRSIVSDQNLARETQQANKEELERIERLRDRNKVFESLSQSYDSSKEHSLEEENPLILDINEDTGQPLVKVHPVITKKLKPHQRMGIRFMWNSCYESLKRIKEHPGSGCILAHCMGLGKTLQVLTLVHTLFNYDETETKHVLILCPLSTVSNWKKELKFALEGLQEAKEISLFTLPSKKDIYFKYEIVTKWYFKRKKSILVLGYEGYTTLTNGLKLDKNGDANLKNRILEALVDPGPCLVVCDEGHLIKNKKSVRTMALNNIKTKRRIVLTGTPLQNNLIEYYHMVHFVKPNLLGTIGEFKTNFVNPITNGQYEDSTSYDIKLMRSRTHVLHKLLTETVQRVEETELDIYLPKMLDYAVFVQLHKVQVDLYNQYSNSVRNILEKNTDGRFLADFHMFQYLCTHPYLLTLAEKSKNKNVKEQDVICEEDETLPNLENWWKDKMPEDAYNKIEYGHKLLVLKAIIEECEAIGDKLLVFSQKIAELDLIEHFLKTIGTKQCQSWKKNEDYHRMDGTVSPDYRTIICDSFNDRKNNQLRLLLMSTKVGGLGLNLTAANRVVIMTVHWNPSYDTQSVFRVYRFGQTKPVFIYRLISLDTMEEKVYQRSVTKLAIARRVVDKHQITRHYKSVDLQEIYSCQPTSDNERPTPNVPEDEMLAKLILKLPFIFKYHEHKTLLANRPEDKLTEQEMTAAWEEFKNKDKPRLAPAPTFNFPQQNNIINPTFDQAYNLGKYNIKQPSTSRQKIFVENGEGFHQQYYIPKPQSNNTVAEPTRRENRTSLDTFSIQAYTLKQSKNPATFSSRANLSKTNNSIERFGGNNTAPLHNASSSNAFSNNSRSLVQNPFTCEGTSSMSDKITVLRQVTSKPVKRKFGPTEVIIKKTKNFNNPFANTSNVLLRQITAETNKSKVIEPKASNNLIDNKDVHDLFSRGVTVTAENSKTNKENDGVISLV